MNYHIILYYIIIIVLLNRTVLYLYSYRSFIFIHSMILRVLLLLQNCATRILHVSCTVLYCIRLLRFYCTSNGCYSSDPIRSDEHIFTRTVLVRMAYIYLCDSESTRSITRPRSPQIYSNSVHSSCSVSFNSLFVPTIFHVL